MSFWDCFSCLRFPNDELIHQLDYTSCSLQELPEEIWQYEKTLETLILSSNHLTELPQDILNFQLLKTLKLNDNELDQIPNNIGILRQLQKLDLSRNTIKIIPDSIKLLKNLTHLDLSLNNIQRLPDAITNLLQLEELLLNETYLEFLPTNIGRLINLKILELRSNNLITLPKSIGLLTALQRLDIGANEFTELPEVVGNLNQLRELWIDFNKICRIPANISNLSELIHFEANSNQLISLPNEISNWRNLQVMSVSTNELEDIPFSIGMLKQLITLKCDNNQLKELPDSICHLINIEEIILKNNSILRLPNTIGMLKKLKFLELDENALRRLPNELSHCQNLTVLSVHSNNLNELPDNIGLLINLTVLNIINNMITYLPVSILNLKNLHALWLHENQTQPLIPLQYYETNQLYLTCYLLPQQNNEERKIPLYVLNNEGNYDSIEIQNEENLNISEKNRQQEQNMLINSKNPTVNGYHNMLNFNCSKPPQWLYFEQKQMCLLNRNNINIKESQITASPLKKIWFADETDIKNKCENENVIGNNNIAMNPSCSSSDALSVTSKLMRSPTPYPKELRVMAKYVRNQNNQQDQLYDSKIIKVQDNLDMSKQSVSHVNNKSVINNELQNKIFNNDTYLNKMDSALMVSQLQNSCDPSLQCIDYQQLSIQNRHHQQLGGGNLIGKQHQHQQNLVNTQVSSNGLPFNSYEIIDYAGLNQNNMYVHCSSSDALVSQQNIPIQYHLQMTNNNQQLQEQHPISQQENLITNGVKQTNIPNSNEHNTIENYSGAINCQDINLVHYLTVNDSISTPPLSSSPLTSSSLSTNTSNLLNNNKNRQSSSSTENQQNTLPLHNHCLTSNNELKQSQTFNSLTSPPPYYVAKNYTKKSQEDLLNYNTLRNIKYSQKQQFEDSVINKNNNDINHDILNPTENILDNNIKNVLDKNNIDSDRNDDVKQIQNLNYLNNNHKINELNNIDYNNDENYIKIIGTQNAIVNSKRTKMKTNLDISNVENNSKHEEIISNINDISEAENDSRTPSEQIFDINSDESKFATATFPNSNKKKINSQKWLFGTHKNPTVKQVMVKKDPGIGFGIKEIQHQGIFVGVITQNTSAAGLLKIDDKILDVDGYDFTKLDLNAANQILNNSGPSLSIMISRK